MKLFSRHNSNDGAPDPVDRSFERQMKYEGLGALAARKGLGRGNPPYPEGSFEWNHWVYGNDNEWSRWFSEENPSQALFCSTAEMTPRAQEEWNKLCAERDLVFTEWKAGKQ